MGFFTTRSEKRWARGRRVMEIRRKAPALDVKRCNEMACEVCTLANEKIQSPQMKPSGSNHPRIYILGEAPGAWEDQDGIQFVGRSGQYLRKQFPSQVRKTLRFNNCVRCRPPDNRTPSPLEVECCRQSILKDIEKTKPEVVLGVGDVALRWMTGQTGIKHWCGRYIPIRVGKHACWFMPILHPAFVLRARNGSDREWLSTEWADVFESHCAKVVRDLFTERLELPDPEDLEHLYDGIEIIECDRRGLKRLRKRLQAFDAKAPLIPVAIDLETHHLRPYHSDSVVLTFSLSDGTNTIAVPLDHPGAMWDKASRKEVLRLLEAWLHGPCIKIAHNALFEMEWLAELFGLDILRSCSWDDTMVQAYILDERKGNMGLDSLTLQYFGFNLKAQSDIDRNKLRETPLDKVLRYNGLDSRYTARLDGKQRGRLDAEGSMGDYRFHMKRLPSIVHAQALGLPIDQREVRKYDNLFIHEIEKAKAGIKGLKEVKQFEAEVGPFNPASTTQLTKLIVNYIHKGQQIERKDHNRKSKYSTDKVTLALLKHPIARYILRLREMSKLHGTYISNLLPGGSYLYPDGCIHTEFHTTFTATRRLSSDNPNVQNFPMHKHAEVRSVVVTPPGCVLVSGDYGQIEARVIAMASKDKVLLKALWERYDIHMDWARRIERVCPSVFTPYRDEAETKEKAWDSFRSVVKNKWVFPTFYGSFCERLARNLDIPIRKAQGLYDEFWDMFNGVRKWQDRLLAFYDKHLYVETLTGHRRHAPLSRNMIFNSPVQGTASDIVVDAGDRVSEAAETDDKPWLQWRLNIHDDLTFAVPKDKVEDALVDIVPTMVILPFKWVIAPISVDISIGPNWYNKKKIGTFSSDEL